MSLLLLLLLLHFCPLLAKLNNLLYPPAALRHSCSFSAKLTQRGFGISSGRTVWPSISVAERQNDEGQKKVDPRILRLSHSEMLGREGIILIVPPPVFVFPTTQRCVLARSHIGPPCIYELIYIIYIWMGSQTPQQISTWLSWATWAAIYIEQPQRWQRAPISSHSHFSPRSNPDRLEWSRMWV